MTSELQRAVDESNASVEEGAGQRGGDALSVAAGTCAELEQVLQILRHDAETCTTAADIHQAADADSAAAASTIADLERQNRELRDAKDREVTALGSEVKRLKAAIGQLVGVGAAT